MHVAGRRLTGVSKSILAIIVVCQDADVLDVVTSRCRMGRRRHLFSRSPIGRGWREEEKCG